MWHTYFYQPSWCVMLIPNNIKEMREEKDLPSGYPKRNKANFRSILHKNMKMIKILFGISLSMFLNALSNEQPNTHTHKHTLSVSLVSANNWCLISHTACYGTYLRGSCGKQMMDGVDVTHIVLPGREVKRKKGIMNISWELISLCQIAPQTSAVQQVRYF